MTFITLYKKDERSVNYRNCVVSIQHMNELFVIKRGGSIII